jgi:hypothetical protein
MARRAASRAQFHRRGRISQIKDYLATAEKPELAGVSKIHTAGSIERCGIASSLPLFVRAPVLAFAACRVMNRHAPIKRRKGFTTMSNAEATTIETTATVAKQGTTVAPEKASSKKGATQKKNAPREPDSRQGLQSQARAKEGSHSRQKGREALPGSAGFGRAADAII